MRTTLLLHKPKQKLLRPDQLVFGVLYGHVNNSQRYAVVGDRAGSLEAPNTRILNLGIMELLPVSVYLEAVFYPLDPNDGLTLTQE